MSQMNSEPPAKFDEWCLVELMGHNRIVGKCSEATMAGGAFLRVDVPAHQGDAAFTRFYRPEAIYCISPITETVALAMVANSRNEPVSRYEIPQLRDKFSSDENPDPNDEPNE